MRMLGPCTVGFDRLSPLSSRSACTKPVEAPTRLLSLLMGAEPVEAPVRSLRLLMGAEPVEAPGTDTEHYHSCLVCQHASSIADPDATC
jgi:hypothetical protein